MVNISRAKQGLQHVGISSFCNCAHIINPIRTTIGKSKQGSSHPESPWSKARLHWITQYAIRLGNYKQNTETTEEFPAKFDILKLRKFETSQIG